MPESASWGGGVWSGGCPLLGGVWSRGCLLPGVFWSGGVWSGGCLVLGGVWSGGCLPPGGCGIPACTEADTSPPVNRMTNRCKNITLATTSLRPVTTTTTSGGSRGDVRDARPLFSPIFCPHFHAVFGKKICK